MKVVKLMEYGIRQWSFSVESIFMAVEESRRAPR